MLMTVQISAHLPGQYHWWWQGTPQYSHGEGNQWAGVGPRWYTSVQRPQCHERGQKRSEGFPEVLGEGSQGRRGSAYPHTLQPHFLSPPPGSQSAGKERPWGKDRGTTIKHLNHLFYPITIHTCHLPYICNLWLEGCYGFRCDIMTGDDLFERVKEEVLTFWVFLDLWENEWEVLSQVTCTHTAWGERKGQGQGC